jgi:acyl-CoA reductase-like NAD-dependent aldehyde dehydrogenase
LANDSCYGLTAAVPSQDINPALNIAHSAESGIIFVRCSRIFGFSVIKPFEQYVNNYNWMDGTWVQAVWMEA